MEKLESYKGFQPHMQTMDLLQWHGTGFISRIISWKTRDRKTGHPGPSHSSTVIRYPDFELGEPRRWTLEATSKGLYPNYLSRRLQNFHGQVFWHRLKPEFQNVSAYSAGWMMEHVGVGYDWLGTGRNLFGKVNADALAMFCSEAIFLGWQWAVIKLGIKSLIKLATMKKAPVPAGMIDLGMYDEVGVPILNL